LLVAKPDDSSGFDLTSSVDYAGLLLLLLLLVLLVWLIVCLLRDRQGFFAPVIS